MTSSTSRGLHDWLPSWAPGSNEMAERVRSFDWSTTPLGPLESWPQSLRTVVGLMLASRQPVYVAWGPQHTSLYNDGYIPILGNKHPECLGRSYAEVFSEIWSEYQPLVEATMSGQAQYFVDQPVALTNRAGLPMSWFTFSWTPLRDETGVVAGWYCSAMETTEKVRAEDDLRKKNDAALRRSQADVDRYRTVLDNIDVGFCFIRMIFDAEGRPNDYEFLDTNRAFTQQTGLVDAVGRRIREFVPNFEQHWFDTYGRVAMTGEPVNFENGAEGLGARWFDVHALRVGDPREHCVAVLFNDISVRKRMDEDLRRFALSLEQQVEERTQDRNRLWQLSSDIMLRCDFTGRIMAVNPAWTDMLGWREEELIGRTVFEFIHPEDIQKTQGGVESLSAGHGHKRFDNRYRHKDGSYRWISWSTVPHEGVINAVGRDFTAEKEKAEALATLEEQLRQSQKMEAVGQLTGGLAHDFNNLLAGISGSLELLSIRVAQGRFENLERYTASAQGAAKRAAALTHRLLAFSRRQTLDPKPTDINGLIAGMEELIRRTVGPGIALEVIPAADLRPTLVDSHQLENALLNLCLNARDAMPDGGRLRIETSNCSITPKVARERDMEAGEYIQLTVSDTGTGMTPEVVAKAFEPFFTTKPLGVGTGLGLSMIYGFVRQSGGHIRIDTRLGEGTAMSLYLPRHEVKAERAQAEPQLSEAPRARVGETVLVVDDEEVVRMIILEVLEDLGYTAIEAADGASGLKVLQSDARIDLLITDVGLPGGMNGRQLADAARVKRPELKVLFVTGYAETAIVGKGQLEPGMHVMTKPFAMEALAAKIKTLITASPKG